jgi:hypothetical protein
MPRKPLFTIFCMIAGFIIGALGALVLFAQCLEWWSFGNWNPVSVRYALNYFAIHPPHFVSTAFGIQRIFNSLEDEFLNLPLSIVLLGIGGLIAAIGAKHAQQRGKKAREKSK